MESMPDERLAHSPVRTYPLFHLFIMKDPNFHFRKITKKYTSWILELLHAISCETGLANNF